MEERELSETEELAEIEDRTNEDGTVDVTIESWEKEEFDKTSDKVTVEFEVIDSIESDTMDWPEPGAGLEDNKFKRMLDHVGLEMRNADLIEGETVTARRSATNGNWYLSFPKDRSTMEKLINFFGMKFDYLQKVPWFDIAIGAFWVFAVTTLMYSVVSLV